MTEVDLTALANQVTKEYGFIPDFSPPLMNELATIKKNYAIENVPNDHRDKLWVSIDNSDSKDLDQLSFAEKDAAGNSILYVAVANVDGLVKNGSEIDKRAEHNTSTIYTPTVIFPMLPLDLSTNLTSLNENEDRTAIVIKMRIDEAGSFEFLDTYIAKVRNYAKLAYDDVAEWLERQKPLPKFDKAVHDQLLLQDQISMRILKFRNQSGSLDFDTGELFPIMKNNVPVGLSPAVHNRAHMLIENCMIAANASLSKYFEKNNIPFLKRIVREPKRWDRIVEIAQSLHATLPSTPDVKALQAFLIQQRKADPQHFTDLSLCIIKLIGRGEYILNVPGQTSPGHFDLALQDYAHTTAPNRRYPDLIVQRLLKSHLANQELPYSTRDLKKIADHCTQKEDDANKLERRLRKSAAAIVMQPQVGKQFPAIVTGVNPNGTWVKLKDPAVEGKLVKGFKNLDVGDNLEVTLISVDVAQGHIDFAKV